MYRQLKFRRSAPAMLLAGVASLIVAVGDATAQRSRPTRPPPSSRRPWAAWGAGAARWYDPGTRKISSTDPIPVPRLTVPGAVNRVPGAVNRRSPWRT